MNLKSLKESGFEIEVDHYRLNSDDFNTVNDFVGKIRRSMEVFYENEVKYDKLEEMFGVRPELQRNMDNDKLAPRGGKTEVKVTKNGKVSIGVAHCSFRDNYNRTTGRNIALGRALEAFKNNIVV